MSLISINDVCAEMVLEKDCLDSRGNLLIEKGTSLSQQWIDRLKNRGIQELHVVIKQEISSDERRLLDLQKNMKKNFSPVLHKPHMASLAKATYSFLKNLSAR